jgi:hypothetical protein
VSAKGRCGAGRNHPIHVRALGLPGNHDWSTCKVPPEPKKPKAIPSRSEKMQTFYTEQRIPLVQLVLARAGYRCEVLSPYHERESDFNPVDVHEIATRGREGGIMAEGVNTPENCVAACRRCHDAISNDPDWAEEHGFLLPASPVSSKGGNSMSNQDEVGGSEQ